MNLTVEQMRAAGYAAVDQVVSHFESIGTLPVRRGAPRIALENLPLDIPSTGRPIEEVLAQVKSDILSHIALPAHPRFFAFVPGPGNYTGALAAFLSQGFNVFAGNWFAGSGPAMVELKTVDWLRRLAGFPESAFGLFLSGGSIANLTALAVARDVHLGEDGLRDGVIYCSDQTHSSVDRALWMLGFARRQITRLPADRDFRLSLPLLVQALAVDRDAGRKPFCVIANAGTTNTGAVDPLLELADICRKEGLWLHVDGAYGGASMICAEGRRLLAGIEHADSLTLDPHKWLFQPFDCGCVLLRDGEQLFRSFHMRPEYLRDVGDNLAEPNFLDYGPELTRPFRALKLWMTLQVEGTDALERAVVRGFNLARLAEVEVRALPDWEIVTPAQMAMLSFRYCPPDLTDQQADEANHAIGLRITHSGFAAVLSTTLRSRSILRMCTINWRTTEDDIRQTIRELGRIARDHHP